MEKQTQQQLKKHLKHTHTTFIKTLESENESQPKNSRSLIYFEILLIFEVEREIKRKYAFPMG